MALMPKPLRCLVLLVGLLPAAAGQGTAEEAAATFTQATVTADQNRPVTLEVGRPEGEPTAAIVFFHGANAAPERYRKLTEIWTDAGYLTVSPLNIDSEVHPARETEDRQRILKTRLVDAVLAVEHARAVGGPDIALIATGHSYGAYIAQILGGATVIGGRSGAPLGLTVPEQLTGVLALSPPPAIDGFSPPGSWTTVARPMLVQTGTTDVSPPFVTEWSQHLDSYRDRALARGWAAVYEDVDHYFNGIYGRPQTDIDPRSQEQFEQFMALTLAFFDFCLDTAGQQNDFAQTLIQFSDLQEAP